MTMINRRVYHGTEVIQFPLPHHPQTRPFASVAFLSLTDELDAHIIKQLLLALVVGIIWRVFPYYYYLSPARLRVSSSFEDTDVINTLQSANYHSPPVFCRLNHGFVDLFNTITCSSQKVLAGTKILRSCMGRVRVNLWAEGITQWLHRRTRD